MFAEVVVSTDSEATADISRHYGAAVPFLRPTEYSGDTSPDIEFVEHALNALRADGRDYECFSILRPTSPFRKAETIRRAWEQFLAEDGADSLRAVERREQHPAKMWVVRGRRRIPLIPFGPAEQPWHSSQYQTLPEVYIQNASLEIAWTKVATVNHTIAGNTLMPFITVDDEGLDVNSEYDWMLVERMVEVGDANLPPISQTPYPLKN